MRDGHLIRLYLGPLGFTCILTRTELGAHFHFTIHLFKLGLHFGLSASD